MDHSDPLILFGICIADLATAVRGTVIDKNQIKVLKRLGQDAVNTFLQVFLHFVYRNDHCDYCHVHHLPHKLTFPIISYVPLDPIRQTVPDFAFSPLEQ